MFSQLTIFFLFFGGLQGVLFASFLIRRKLHRSGYVFLLLYFGVMLLQITLKLMSKGWLIDNWKVLYELSYQLPFLYGPFIYLFTRQLIQRRQFQSIDLLHFTPFAILVFFFVLGYSYSESPVVLFPFLLAKYQHRAVLPFLARCSSLHFLPGWDIPRSGNLHRAGFAPQRLRHL